jgi:hypothetical protein
MFNDRFYFIFLFEIEEIIIKTQRCVNIIKHTIEKDRHREREREEFADFIFFK